MSPSKIGCGNMYRGMNDTLKWDGIGTVLELLRILIPTNALIDVHVRETHTYVCIHMYTYIYVRYRSLHLKQIQRMISDLELHSLMWPLPPSLAPQPLNGMRHATASLPTRPPRTLLHQLRLPATHRALREPGHDLGCSRRSRSHHRSRRPACK